MVMTNTWAIGRVQLSDIRRNPPRLVAREQFGTDPLPLFLADPIGYADAGTDLRHYCLLLAWRQPAK